MFGFDSKDCFFVFRGFFGFEIEKQKTLGCFSVLNGYDQSGYHKKTHFFVFETCQCRKPNLKC